MAGGSAGPENPTDGQCSKCGLWYRDVGVSLTVHEASCNGEETPRSAEVETETEVAPEQLPNETEVAPDATPGMGGLPADEPPDRKPSSDPYVCHECGHKELVDVRKEGIECDYICEKCGTAYHDR